VEAYIKWLEGSHIGKVSDYSRVNSIMEEVIQNWQGRLSLKYLGENAILLQGNNVEAETSSIIGENKKWWEAKFDSINLWKSSQVVQNKLVWVR